MSAYRDDPPKVETAKLRGVDATTQGHERECRAQVIVRHHLVNESTAPALSSRIRAEIVDTDNFPNGDYELEFDDGSKENVRRREDGRYYGGKGTNR